MERERDSINMEYTAVRSMDTAMIVCLSLIYFNLYECITILKPTTIDYFMTTSITIIRITMGVFFLSFGYLLVKERKA